VGPKVISPEIAHDPKRGPSFQPGGVVLPDVQRVWTTSTLLLSSVLLKRHSRIGKKNLTDVMEHRCAAMERITLVMHKLHFGILATNNTFFASVNQYRQPKIFLRVLKQRSIRRQRLDQGLKTHRFLLALWVESSKFFVLCSVPYTRTIEPQAEKLLQEYLDAPPSTLCLLFWKDYSKSGNVLKLELSKIALFYLTPLLTSTDVERLFSTAGDILTKERNRLVPKNAENCYFVKKICHCWNFSTRDVQNMGIRVARFSGRHSAKWTCALGQNWPLIFYSILNKNAYKAKFA
jgi:hypothetical protein